jgi:hypothetical protein
VRAVTESISSKRRETIYTTGASGFIRFLCRPGNGRQSFRYKVSQTPLARADSDTRKLVLQPLQLRILPGGYYLDGMAGGRGWSGRFQAAAVRAGTSRHGQDAISRTDITEDLIAVITDLRLARPAN